MENVKLNPDNKMLQQLDGHWQKLLAFVLFKLAPDGVEITLNDMKKCNEHFKSEGGISIFTHGHLESIVLQTISLKHARDIAALDKLNTTGTGN